MLPKKISSIVVLRGKVFVGSSWSKSERVVVALLLWWLRVQAFVSGAITPSFAGSLRISLSFVDTCTYENTYKHYCALVILVVIVNYINKIAPFHKLLPYTTCFRNTSSDEMDSNLVDLLQKKQTNSCMHGLS